MNFLNYLALSLALAICILSDADALPPSPPNPFHSSPKTLDSMLAKYDRREIPGGFANVSVDVFLRNIFLETKSDIPYMRLVFTLRQYWNDPSLVQAKDDSNARNFTLTTGEDMGRVWTPDTFVQNDAFPESIRFDGHTPALIKFFPCGTVVASIMAEKKVFCPVKAELHEKDQVKCYLKLASYGHTQDRIDYHWKDDVTPPEMERLGKRCCK